MSRAPMRPFTAAILAGGLGTRLRSVVADRQKVVAEIGGRPYVAWLLDQLAAAGVGEVVLCTGHLGEHARALIGDDHEGMRLLWSQEPQPLGTAGALGFAKELLRDADPLLVLNGDSFCDVDLCAYRAWHHEEGGSSSLVATRVEDASRFGGLSIEGSRVTGFREKGVSGPGWINAGIYLLSAAVVETLPASPSSLERDVLPHLDLRAFLHRGSFVDIGTPESFVRAEATLKAPRAPRRFVLLDRDGCLNVERGYLSDPEAVELVPGAGAALRSLRRAGFGLCVLTNQSGLARGYFDRARLDAIHERLGALLALEGVHLDGIFVCPHHPDDRCSCRKPAPGLAHQAAAALAFDLADAVMVGDKACDIGLAVAAGIPGVLVETGYGAGESPEARARAAAVVPDLAAAAAWIRGR